MAATIRKLLYALVVLLFVLIIALIGWLAHVLIAFEASSPPGAAPAPVVAVKYAQPKTGPSSERLINIDAPPDLPTEMRGLDEVTFEGASGMGSVGHIPCICEGYGPLIRNREAFVNPLTHETVVSATRAVVTLTLNPAATQEEP